MTIVKFENEKKGSCKEWINNHKNLLKSLGFIAIGATTFIVCGKFAYQNKLILKRDKEIMEEFSKWNDISKDLYEISKGVGGAAFVDDDVYTNVAYKMEKAIIDPLVKNYSDERQYELIFNGRTLKKMLKITVDEVK